MENNRLDPTALEEEDLNWEKRLERLRQARQFNTAPTHAPLVKKSEEAVDVAPKTAPKKEYKLDADNREKVLQEYLYRWQLEHNTALAEDGEAVETDAMVVLQDNWLSAQSALQAAASDRHIESTRTVRLNPKSGAVDFDVAEVEETEKPENDGTEAAEGAVSDGILPYLTYLKTGRWQMELGGLESPATNQKFINLHTGEVLNRLFIKDKPAPKVFPVASI